MYLIFPEAIDRGADQNKDESLISGNDNMDIDSISDVVGGAAGHDRGSCGKQSCYIPSIVREGP